MLTDATPSNPNVHTTPTGGWFRQWRHTAWWHQRVAALASSLLLIGLGVTTIRLLHIDIGPLFIPLLMAPLLIVIAAPISHRNFWIRVTLAGLAILFLLGLSFTVQITKRTQSGTRLFLHDGAVQTEAALNFLHQGVNPYAADYRATPFGEFPDMFSGGQRPNPAWTHYVYAPFHLVGSLPFYEFFRSLTNGWFDQRLVYVAMQILATVFVVGLAKRWGREWQLLIGIVFVLNPFWVPLFVYGFNDIFVFALLAGSLWCLTRKQPIAAGVWFGLALASKQSTWLFIPFFVLYLYCQRQELRRWRAGLVTAALTAAAVYVPFFLWSPSDLIADLIQFPTGKLATSYPVSGSGFSVWLLDQGFIHSRWDYYSFWGWQLFVAGPVFLGALWFLWRDKRLHTALIGAALAGGVYWFFSRYFNVNHIAYLIFLLIAAWALYGPPQRWQRTRPTAI